MCLHELVERIRIHMARHRQVFAHQCSHGHLAHRPVALQHLDRQAVARAHTSNWSRVIPVGGCLGGQDHRAQVGIQQAEMSPPGSTPRMPVR